MILARDKIELEDTIANARRRKGAMSFAKNQQLRDDAERRDAALERCPECGSIPGQPHRQDCPAYEAPYPAAPLASRKADS